MEFRGWDLEENCWIPSDQILVDGNGLIFTRGENDEEGSVIRETVPIVIAKSTGYRDQKGSIIFDGDIFRLSEKETVYVEWNQEKSSFEVKSWNGQTINMSMAFLSTNAVIRGNVFEDIDNFEELQSLRFDWNQKTTSWQKIAYDAVKNLGSNDLIYRN